MEKYVIRNWKTSLCGFVLLFSGIFIGLKSGNWEIAAPCIAGGAGLIAAMDGKKENA